MTPQCQQMQDNLKAYHDRELPPLQRLSVRRHLAHCAACREEMKIMEQIGQQLKADETQPTLNPTLREKILTAIPEEKVETGASARPKYSGAPAFYQSFLFKSGAVVTAVLLFLVVVPFFGRSRENAEMADSSVATSPASPKVEVDTFSRSSSRARSSDDFSPLAKKRSYVPQEMEAQRIPAPAGAYRQVAPSSVPGSVTGMEYSVQKDTSNVPSSERRVHQEARIAVEVTDLEDKSNTVISVIKSAGGFVANNALSTGADGLKSAALTVKVPVKQFETVLAEVGKLGEVKAKSVTGEDITQQFSDAQQADQIMASDLAIKEAQLKAALKRAEEAEKAKKPIPDNWQLRAEARRLRIEAAQARARLTLLKKISDLADISIELREKPRTASEGGFTQQMSDTSRAAMDSFLLAARLPVTLLIWVLAYAPLWLPMLLIYRFASRAYQRKTP